MSLASSKALLRALEQYDAVIARQGVARLVELDRWYRHELPAAVAKRKVPHVTKTELVRATEWKMARGVWRQGNLVLVRGNEAAAVEATSRDALRRIPDPKAPIATLATLDGVGPATASAIVAAVAPERYPFFDEVVATQLKDLGPVKWTLGYYLKYPDALRGLAAKLGGSWTPVLLERALWAHAGGKAGVAGE